MIARLHRPRPLLVGLWLAAALVIHVTAQPPTKLVPHATLPGDVPQPPKPVLRSPISVFRELLTLKPDQREKFLEQFAIERRQPLLDKVHAYEAMKGDEREDLLRTTELRWYLMIYMRTPATNRLAQLTLVPDTLRPLVADRLQHWDQLSVEQQREVLEYESTLQYFVPKDASRPVVVAAAGTKSVSDQPGELVRSVDHWNSLPVAQREELRGRFETFFRLSPDERQQNLNGLSSVERMQMAKSLQDFSRLPEARRDQCLKAFARFANLSREERNEFLRNAERWKEMPAAERQAWRNLVQRFPQMPPMPGAPLPMPPVRQPPKFPAGPGLATTNTDQ